MIINLLGTAGFLESNFCQVFKLDGKVKGFKMEILNPFT